MTNREAAEEIQKAINLIMQDGKDWLNERDIPILEMAINALTKEAWKEEHPVSPLLQKPATTAQPEKTQLLKKDATFDCISIQAANYAICNACGMIDCDQMDKCKKLFTAQAEKHTQERTETHACDCVERAAAIDVVEYGIIYANEINANTRGVKKLCKERNDALRKAAERIKELPPAQPQRTGRWIPCSERLPELDVYVIATTQWYEITMACRIGDGEWFINEGDSNAYDDDVIAWMPLPEAYREGD